MSIRQSLVRTAGAKYTEIVLGFISSVILARLLTPEDFGIYSIAASIVLIGHMFRNFGVTQYIIQAEKLTDDILRTSFSLTLLISWLIALAIGSTAHWVSGYYENPGLETALLLLSINFWLLPFGAVPGAVLRRDMAFGKLAVITVCVAFVGFMVGITSAWMGGRYLSIVWASNASTLTTILLTLYFRPKRLPWLPGWKGVGEISRFGIKVGLLDLVNLSGNSATELMIGKSHGLHDVGLYSRAFGLFRLVERVLIEAIYPVILPYLSEAKRQRASFGELYLKMLQYSSILMLPVFAFVFLMAEPLVLTLYGNQWLAAVPILEALALAGPLLVPTLFFDQLLIAHKRPGLALRIQASFQAVRLGCLLMLLSGSLSTLAIAFVIGMGIKMALVIHFSAKLFQLQALDFAKTLAPSLLSMFLVGLAVFVVDALLPTQESIYLSLLLAMGIAAAAWLASIYLLKHPVAQEIDRLLKRA